jgi:hypothetical protein
MEFFQDTDGTRTPLAKKNIDTGSGFERVTRILQQVGLGLGRDPGTIVRHAQRQAVEFHGDGAAAVAQRVVDEIVQHDLQLLSIAERDQRDACESWGAAGCPKRQAQVGAISERGQGIEVDALKESLRTSWDVPE